MAFEDLEFDESKILKGLDEMIERMALLEQTTADVQKSFNTAFTSITVDGKKADAAFDAAAAGAKKLTAGAKETTQEVGTLRKGLGELLGDIRVFGVSLGSLTNGLKTKASALKQVVTGLGAGSNALKVFKVALISTGVGALVVALGTLIAYFGTAEKATNKVSLVLAGLGGVVTAIVNTMGKLGSSVLKVFQGDFTGAFKEAKSAVTGFNDELKKGVTTMVALEQRTQDLKDRQREAAVTTSEIRKEINALNIIASDSTKTYKERHEAQTKLGELEKAQLAENVALRQEELDIILEKNKANPFFADLQAEADARIALNEIQTESFSNQKKQQNALNSLRAEEAARVQAIIEKQKELRLEVERMAEDLINQAAEIERTRLSPADRIKAETELAVKLIELEFSRLDEKAKAAGIEINLEKEKALIIDQIQREGERKRLESFNQSTEDWVQANRERAEKMIKAADEEFGLAALKRDAEQLEAAKAQQEKFGKIISDGVKAGLAKMNQEAESSPLNGFELLGRRISTALGFSADGEGDEQFAQFMGAIESTVGSVFDSINARINSQIEANQAWLDDIREKREELEAELEIERERREEGLANNVDAKERELNEIAKKEAQALKEQEELKKKAVQAQLLQDGASQLSSLVTAAAGIIEGFSKVPILGVVLGIAAVASMFAFFASAKAKAKESSRGYAGGFLGDILGPNASTEDLPGRGQGTYIHPDLIANAREYLVNGDSTAANIDHLHKLNAGMYDGLDLDQFLSNFSPDEIADGFRTRQDRLEAYKGLNSARMLKNSMSQAFAAYSAGIVKAINKKPVVVSSGPGDTLRIWEDGNFHKITVNE